MKTNWTTLLISLAAGVNTELIAFHFYHLSNTQLQGLDSLISFGVMIFGVIFSHKKPFLDAVKQLFGKKQVESK